MCTRYTVHFPSTSLEDSTTIEAHVYRIGALIG